MESDMQTNLAFNLHCGDEIVSSCCSASEHKWFPLMCSDCGDFTDFLCTSCGKIIYSLEN